MVYSRDIDGEELTFEASGGLRDAALVMRDRETDSWWSIMTADAIGGELEGSGLEELAAGEKMTWAEWRRRYPQTLVLSIGGREHESVDPYSDYFASQRTFAGTKIEDTRLPAKAQVFSFRHGGRPYAVALDTVPGAALLSLGDDSRPALLVHRRLDTPLRASSQAWLVQPALLELDADTLLAMAREGAAGISRVVGFDTFWYTWIAANPDTVVLEASLRTDTD